MSKSLGNTIDPLDVIEGRSLQDLQARLDSSNLSSDEIALAKNSIAKLFPQGISPTSSDALRMALLKHDVQSADINFDPNLPVSMHHFTNKLNNAFKYAHMIFQKSPPPEDYYQFLCCQDPVNAWILSRLQSTIETVDSGISNFDFPRAVQALYEFVWLELCDVYLEYTKLPLWTNDDLQLSEISLVLTEVLSTTAKLLAPFMPVMAEELFTMLPMDASSQSVHQQSFPALKQHLQSAKIDQDMTSCMKIVRALRSTCAELAISRKTEIQGYLFCSAQCQSAVENMSDLLSRVSRLKIHERSQSEEMKAKWIAEDCIGIFVDESTELYVKLECIDRSAVVSRIQRQVHQKQQKRAKILDKRQNWSRNDEETWQKRMKQSDNAISNLDSEISKLNDILVLVQPKSSIE